MPARSTDQTPSVERDLSTHDTNDEGKTVVEEVRAAIELYTDVAERRLKPGLDSACEQRDKLFEALQRLDAQKHALETLSGKSGMIRTRANIGEEFYVGAEVNVEQDVVLELSEGVMVEVSISEALRLVNERKELLERLSERATRRIVSAQAHLKAVLDTISTLRVGCEQG